MKTQPPASPRTARPPAALLLLALLLGLAAPFAARAADAFPPGKLTYQGFLTDKDGRPYGNANPANLVVTFRIYSASTGGNDLIWSEKQNVTFDKGHFSVLLGEGSVVTGEPNAKNLTTVFGGANASDRFLELTIGTASPIAPRLQFLPAPFAVLARKANSVVGSNGEIVLTTGTRSVGINTPTPASALDVNGTITATGLNIAGNVTATSFTGTPVFNNGLTIGGPVQSSGGNARGLLAVDMQVNRANTNQVASGEYSVIAGGTANTASGATSAVGGGQFNTNSGVNSTIAGGYKNTVSGNESAIGGGNSNTVSGVNSATAGGIANSVSGDQSVVAGGHSNQANGNGSTVGGGYKNTASQSFSTVAGGNQNNSSGDSSAVGGGAVNTNSGAHAFIGGGYLNAASGPRSAIGGGAQNAASGYQSTIGGGYNNQASYNQSTVAGGYQNNSSGDSSAVGGGAFNTNSGHYSTIGGGYQNVASGLQSTIGGGYNHRASYNNSTVAGGYQNNSSGESSTVGGGAFNTNSGHYSTIGGGYQNAASQSYATVPGGQQNTAAGVASFAAGRRAKANHGGSFVSADNQDADFTSTKDNSFIIRATGYVGIGTAAPEAPLHVAGSKSTSITGYSFLDSNGQVQSTGTKAFSVSIIADQFVKAFGYVSTSDRRIKEIVKRADTGDDLKTIQQLQVTDYRMVDKVQNGNGVRKGFIAQEVQAVIPGAVTAGRSVVPSIYSLPAALKFEKEQQTLQVTMTNAHDLKAGDLVRLFTDQTQLDLKVTAVPTSTSFVVGMTNAPKQLFVYGKPVDDFLSVDYNRIFTSGIGAIQELAKQVETLKATASRVEVLESELTELKKLVARLAEAQKANRPVAAAPAAPTTATPNP